MQIDDSRPIWVQLVAEFRLRIVSGQWAPGSKIPSVRELASSAGVNPNTVQRALAALDRTGLTAAERTAGRFVTADGAVLDAVRAELATEATDAYLTSLTGLGMSLEEVTRLLAVYLIGQVLTVAAIIVVPVGLDLPSHQIVWEGSLPSMVATWGTGEDPSVLGLGFLPVPLVLAAVLAWRAVPAIEKHTSLR